MNLTLEHWKSKVFELIEFDKKKMEKLEKYVFLILETNKLTNLTGFDEEKIWNEGIYQSIFLMNNFLKKQKNIKLLDIGAGAGFPSIPYFIFVENNINLTIIDSSKKRILFLQKICEQLNLKIKLIHCRVEEFNEELETFDYITARAVSSFKNLIEMSFHLGKLNSTYFFLKSKKYLEEIKEAQQILNIFKIEKVDIKKIDLEDKKEHVILSYKKTIKTPKGYPRKWSIINK